MSDLVDDRRDGMTDSDGRPVEVGATYLVHADDCCMAVAFTATLVGVYVADMSVEEEETDPFGEPLPGWPPHRTYWSNGVVLDTDVGSGASLTKQ